MYEVGNGVPQSFSEATKWYRLAAEQGHRNACLYLGPFFLLYYLFNIYTSFY